MIKVQVNVERLVRLQRQVTSLGENFRQEDSVLWIRAQLTEVNREIDSIILEGQGEKMHPGESDARD